MLCYVYTTVLYFRAACNFSPYFDGSPTVIDKRYQWWSRKQLDAIHTDVRKCVAGRVNLPHLGGEYSTVLYSTVLYSTVQYCIA